MATDTILEVWTVCDGLTLTSAPLWIQAHSGTSGLPKGGRPQSITSVNFIKVEVFGCLAHQGMVSKH